MAHRPHSLVVAPEKGASLMSAHRVPWAALAIEKRLGVPLGEGSCHTAEVDARFIGGQVPVEDIRRLLASRGDTRGVMLPGMPAGGEAGVWRGGLASASTAPQAAAQSGSASPGQPTPAAATTYAGWFQHDSFQPCGSSPLDGLVRGRAARTYP